MTKDVTIDLRGYTNEGACSVKIIRNTVEVYNETVEQGVTSITLSGQTSSEPQQKYTVIINETETWDEWVDFN